MSIECWAAAIAASAAARMNSPGCVVNTSTVRSAAGDGIADASPDSARSCLKTRSRLSTTGPVASTSKSWFFGECVPQLIPPTMARAPSRISSFTWSMVRRSSGNATTRTPPCSSSAQTVRLLRSDGSLMAVTVTPRSRASSSNAARSNRWNSYSSMSMVRRAWANSSTIAAKAVGPSGSGTSRSAPLLIGDGTTGARARAAAPGGAVRPGAQEAASSARRRRGNRRQRDGPYTPACYYIFVYLSMPRAPTGPVRNWRYNSAASASMKAFLGIVELVLALLVMLGVLLQTPKASGLGGTIGGGGDSGGGYRTKRGLEKNLFYATIGLVVLFVVVSVVYIRVG